MRLIILSEKFYSEYGGKREILDKRDRPYFCMTVEIDGILYAIPLRHHINHPFGFKTIGDAGLDYSKSVVLKDDTYISADEPRIDSREWNIINRNENRIFYEFRQFLRRYKRAKAHNDNPRSAAILRYCTLQYFEDV